METSLLGDTWDPMLGDPASAAPSDTTTPAGAGSSGGSDTCTRAGAGKGVDGRLR